MCGLLVHPGETICVWLIGTSRGDDLCVAYFLLKC